MIQMNVNINAMNDVGKSFVLPFRESKKYRSRILDSKHPQSKIFIRTQLILYIGRNL